MTTLLTIKEIAKQLQVPESNIRYYRDRFEEYIPSVGEGRRRRYKKEAVDVFSHIVQGLKEDKNTEQIAAELAAMYPRTVSVSRDVNPSGDESDLVCPEQGSFPEMYSHAVLQSQSRTLEHLAQTLARSSSLSTELSRFRDEQERLKKGLVYLWRMHRNGTVQQSPGGYASAEPLAQQVKSLEARLGQLEGHVDRELRKMRSEIKELLSLTREVIKQSDKNSSA